MIDQRLLTLLVLIEEKSYTKAAKKLYITQPAVSQHIKSLEHDYDITLFEDSKTFTLSNSGHILYDYAVKVKEEEELLTHTLKRSTSKTHISVDITPLVLASTTLVNKLRATNTIYQYSRIYTEGAAEIFNHVLTGRADIGLIDNSFDSSLFEYIHLATNNIIIVGSPDGKYKENVRITRDTLISASLILFDQASGLTTTALQTLKNKNIRIKKENISTTTNDLTTFINLIRSTDSIGFIYEESVTEYLENKQIKKLELLNFKATQNIYAIYKKVATYSDEIKKAINTLKKLG